MIFLTGCRQRSRSFSIANARLKLAKNHQMLSSTLRLNFCYLKIIHILHPRYHPEIIGHILENKQKNMCVCIHEIMRLNIMKMKVKTKNKSYRYDIYKRKSRHGYKYHKYKKCLIMTMLICIEQQHPSNI